MYLKPALASVASETTVAGCCTGPASVSSPKLIVAGRCVFNPLPPPTEG